MLAAEIDGLTRTVEVYSNDRDEPDEILIVYSLQLKHLPDLLRAGQLHDRKIFHGREASSPR